MRLIDYSVRYHANFKPFGPPYSSIFCPVVSSHHRRYLDPDVDGLERFSSDPAPVTWPKSQSLYKTALEESGFPRYEEQEDETN